MSVSWTAREQDSATAAVAGGAVICAATAIAGVVAPMSWLLFAVVAVVAIVSAGILLRTLQVPAPLVVACQFIVLVFLITAVFSRQGVLMVLPGPEAVDDLQSLLMQATSEVRIGIPPIETTAAITAVLVAALGLVAILVDLLAVSVKAPAAAGLVLLTVFAVPASLAPEMLPWWTFVLGAVGFATLLAVDGRLKALGWRRAGGSGSGRTEPGRSPMVAITAAAAVLALGMGSTLTFIGTDGRLPGTGGGTQGIGFQPFTSLRGQLNQSDVELFRVRGLEDPRYLRLFTLDQYVAGEGWEMGPLQDGGPAEGALPLPVGTPIPSDITSVQIEPTNFEDPWLPVYGTPTALRGVDDSWRYDERSGTVYGDRQIAEPYTVETSLATPSFAELQAAPDPVDVDPVYLNIEGIPDEVIALAGEITAGAPTAADRAKALNDFFTEPENGFTYSLETEQGSHSDALSDFLLDSRTGYCEQFSSAMAALLRTVGVPSRVALGFTGGYNAGEYRVIGTREAHAWVEAYFQDIGWVTFEPTPSDGRMITPNYLNEDLPDQVDTPTPTEDTAPAETTTTSTSTTDDATSQDLSLGGGATPSKGAPPGALWIWTAAALLAMLGAAVLSWLGGRSVPSGRTGRAGPPDADGTLRLRMLLLAVALAAALPWLWWLLLPAGPAGWWWLPLVPLAAVCGLLGPSFLRSRQRTARFRTISALGPGAASAAWRELLAEAGDRGTDVSPSETVRTTAGRLIRQFSLDPRGAHALGTLVSEVERDWYGQAGQVDPTLPAAMHTVAQSLRQTAPMSWTARLLPRSVLRPRTGRA
ncbi:MULTISPECIES: transglutaminaseTgpA domain-containing protein [Actinoalloteichus]|uniref:Transglutaminase-like enzyme, predicted cysteine protease n=1 Tax=Actinoalloteichus fjordicus TaxID=1612552 RepID=A0AAC9LBT4_9PSEU|nr:MULTISPECIES: DUF3488 and transglutaminase-like domain-containing protein [Actinoalloteichus]APU13980.1 transglutaminase-like enzyme, predicted cysteine protease [Actinoalloteichus fjordicus]APU19926.1 transglutaminase-like enzyme, predicted cysteine protease [Actinoalloteichus sp. GBA129-24]